MIEPAVAPAVLAPDLAPAKLAGVSIVLPCFNEEENLLRMLAEARRAGRLAAEMCEVVVVDDGSSDRTGEIARGIAAAHHEVRVVAHERNRGYGAAVRSGIAAAQMPWLFLTDADLQFDLREIQLFVPLTEHADVLVGRRASRADRWWRRSSADAWNLLVRMLFALPVRDVDCAFKLIRRDLLAGIELEADGAMISTELVSKLVHAGARFEERDVTHRARPAGRSSGGDPRVVARAFAELVRMRRALATR